MADQNEKFQTGNKLDFTVLMQRGQAAVSSKPRVTVEQETIELAKKVSQKPQVNKEIAPLFQQSPTDANTLQQSPTHPDRHQQTSTVDFDSPRQSTTVETDGPRQSPTVESNTPQRTESAPLKEPLTPTFQRLTPDSVNWEKILTSTSRRAVFNYLKVHGNHVTRNEQIAESTGFPLGTIRDVLRVFESSGLIRKEKWVDGKTQGVHLIPLFEGAGYINPQQTPTVVNTLRQTPTHSGLHIEKEKEIFLSKSSTLANSEKTVADKLRALTTDQIRDIYPALASIGFTSLQVDQIVSNLEAINKTPDNLFVALEHADFAVENDLLTRKGGIQISNPQEQLAYIVGGLRKTGYWTAPKGFVPAEVQAQRDAAERDRMLTQAKKEAEDAAFELWRSGLSSEEKGRIRAHQEEKTGGGRGSFLGPEEHWLKDYWKRQPGAVPQ